MLNTIRRLSLSVNQICTRCRSSVAPQSTNEEEKVAHKWQLFVSACISRPPVVCPSLTAIEEKYKKICVEKEFEQAYQSDHELRELEDKVRAKMLTNKHSKNIGDEESNKGEHKDIGKLTALEYEDACNTEYEKYAFSPVITTADKDGDVNSLNRALDRSLVLVSLQTLGKQSIYMLPQITWTEGENLRQTCNRLVRKQVNNGLQVQIFGNAPCGFYNYKYSKALRDHVGYIGAKIFFFSGHVMNLNLQQLQDIRSETDLWLTHDELGNKLMRAYHNAVKQFIISDN